MKYESTVWKTSYALEQAVLEPVTTQRNNGSPYHAHHDSRWKGPSRQAHSKVHKGTARKAIPPFSHSGIKRVGKGQQQRLNRKTISSTSK